MEVPWSRLMGMRCCRLWNAFKQRINGELEGAYGAALKVVF